MPLSLRIVLLDSRTCKPVPDAAVDLWHCDAVGLYSGFTKQNPMGPPPGPDGGPPGPPGVHPLALVLLNDGTGGPGRWGRPQTMHRPTSSPSFVEYSSQARMEVSAFARCFQVSTWGARTTSISRFALAVMLPENRTRLGTLLTLGKYFSPRKLRRNSCSTIRIVAIRSIAQHRPRIESLASNRASSRLPSFGLSSEHPAAGLVAEIVTAIDPKAAADDDLVLVLPPCDDDCVVSAFSDRVLGITVGICREDGERSSGEGRAC